MKTDYKELQELLARVWEIAYKHGQAAQESNNADLICTFENVTKYLTYAECEIIDAKRRSE